MATGRSPESSNKCNCSLYKREKEAQPRKSQNTGDEEIFVELNGSDELIKYVSVFLSTLHIRTLTCCYIQKSN